MINELKLLLSNTPILITIATIGLLGYIAHHLFINKTFNGLTLVNGLVVGVAYLSLIGGIKIWLLSFDEAICKAANVEAQYFFIAGIAAIWMAVQEIGSKHKALSPISNL